MYVLTFTMPWKNVFVGMVISQVSIVKFRSKQWTINEITTCSLSLKGEIKNRKYQLEIPKHFFSYWSGVANWRPWVRKKQRNLGVHSGVYTQEGKVGSFLLPRNSILILEEKLGSNSLFSFSYFFHIRQTTEESLARCTCSHRLSSACFKFIWGA